MGEARRRYNSPCPCGSGKKLKDCCLFEGESTCITVNGHSICLDGVSRRKLIKDMKRLGCEEIVLSKEDAMQAFKDAGHTIDELPKFLRVFRPSQNALDFLEALRGIAKPVG